MREVGVFALVLFMGMGAGTVMAEEGGKRWGNIEEMTPDAIERVKAESPVAYVPLGTYEHHGYHLPICFDGIKAHALCEATTKKTGGVVFPTFFYGTGGGHLNYKWTFIVPEEQIRPLLATTLDELAQHEFKVVVLYTGHYAGEQVRMVHALAKEANERHEGTHFIGVSDPEVTTPLPGDTRRGDHAAKYETSIAMAINPEWVKMDQLTPDRAPEVEALSDTPRDERSTHDPTHPLYAIHGEDPRVHASAENGRKIIASIVGELSKRVEAALQSSNE